MRITQSMMTRNYLKNLNTAAGRIAVSNRRISTQRKYSRLSENVAEGLRALKTREDLYKNEQYVANIKGVENELSSAESNLKSITEVLQTAQERAEKGVNGTIPQSGRDIISKEIIGLQDQVLKTVNAKFGDKFLFSGTNNLKPPFEIANDGKVLYNGFNVDDIFKDTDGKYYANTSTGKTPIPQNEKMFIDIGLGIKMTADKVDPATAFETSFSGLEILGYGKDQNGNPKNVIALLGKMSNVFSPKPPQTFNEDEANKCSNLLKEQTDFAVINMTDIGTRCNFLEKTTERIESDVINLQSLQKKLEGINDAEETMNMKMNEYVWMATLKMGSKIIPVSLMDFIS